MTIAQRLMKWASEIHLAREHAEKIRREMAALRCEHELALEIACESRLYPPGGDHYRFDCDDAKPCWKGHPDRSDGFIALGDLRDSGWCEPCEKREKLRGPYAAAKRRLGSLKGALWRLAATAHAEVEAELDESLRSTP